MIGSLMSTVADPAAGYTGARFTKETTRNNQTFFYWVVTPQRIEMFIFPYRENTGNLSKISFSWDLPPSLGIF